MIYTSTATPPPVSACRDYIRSFNFVFYIYILFSFLANTYIQKQIQKYTHYIVII